MSLGTSRPRNGKKGDWVTRIGLEHLQRGATMAEAKATMRKWKYRLLADVKAEAARLMKERASSGGSVAPESPKDNATHGGVRV